MVPGEQVLDQALALADRVAQRSSFATALLKKTMTQQLTPLRAALDAERAAAMACFAHPDTARRIDAHGGHRR